MKNDPFEQWLTYAKTATEPVLKLNEISAKAMERMARQQFDVAQDYLELGSKQMQLLGATQDPQKWLAEQGDLATEFSKKLMARAEEFAKIAAETQQEMAAWADAAAKQAGQQPGDK